MNSTRTFSSADLALQKTGAIAAAGHGPVAVWADTPVFSGVSATSTAAGWGISAGAQPRPFARFRS